ncbi:efflux RND transporter periplasmic adaptor subunit [Pedobacter sp. N36a]|uniref:efflux RND transporter periplasmic adaptor subunit n=1 Tax=unclassified Pedobacter TaxID=2628915 RepID=UPI00070586B4|nr:MULTISPECIES: efflux RND transporter periplasmic adaptor subunit [unclassified Pedobacter]ALL08155.1 transporter [Pedobacter sp. PACM 27299]MBC8985833.1 efflux RND transporter periplasmic adaptor subunit [Pedobacter sp. N36a]
MKLKPILITLGILIAVVVTLKLTGVIGGEKIEKVTIEKAAERVVTETVTASGKVQPETEVKLSSEVSGEVTELLVKEGDVVKKGQLLIKVRPDVLKSGYDRAVASYSSQRASVASALQVMKQNEGNFVNAEATYKRNVELFNKKVISASEFDAAKAAYLTAKTNLARSKEDYTAAKFQLEQSGANVQEANANLAKATIYAPVNGVISKLSVELGDRILGTAQMAGTEIMRISNLTTMEVNVDVNENDINRVNVGDSAKIEVDAFADKKFKGIVTEIASSSKDIGSTTTSVDQVTNFVVKIRILADSYEGVKGGAKDLPSPFRPGLSATVDIMSQSEKGLAIPIQSVFTESKKADDKPQGDDQNADKQKTKLTDKTVKQFVYIFNAGTVKKVEVTTGIQDDQYIIIKSGVKAGQEVVSGPYSAIQNKLKDGMKVEKTTKDQLFVNPDKK